MEEGYRMPADKVSLTLSIEEMLFLLRLLRAETLPGLPERPFEGMTPEQIAASLVAAERGLQASNLVRIYETERRVEMDAICMALLGVCLIPRFSILVTFQRAGEPPQVRYYHAGSDLVVEHTSPQPGLHTFTGAARIEDFIAPLVELLALPQRSSSKDLAARIRQDSLMQARDQARSGDGDAVIANLEAGGLTRRVAVMLAAALRQPALSISLTRLERFNDIQSTVDGFALLEGADMLWVLSPESFDPQFLRVEAISTDEAVERIKAIMQSSH